MIRVQVLDIPPVIKLNIEDTPRLLPLVGYYVAAWSDLLNMNLQVSFNSSMVRWDTMNLAGFQLDYQSSLLRRQVPHRPVLCSCLGQTGH